ncbi:MAG: lamin tail domain-containing protein [Rudaea sp.]
MLVDWDGNGSANAQDEWIEIYNAGPASIDLAGWELWNGKGGSRSYRFGTHTIIPADGYLVLFRSRTKLDLNPLGDKIILSDWRGRAIDQVTFGPMLTDTSYSRDAYGYWHADWDATPGGPNVPPDLFRIRLGNRPILR